MTFNCIGLFVASINIIALVALFGQYFIHSYSYSRDSYRGVAAGPALAGPLFGLPIFLNFF